MFTHYIKAVTREVPDMAARYELKDISGAALEALNQQMKRTNTSRNGGIDPVLRLLARQLAGGRVVAAWLQYKNKVRATYYERVKTEREGTNLVAKHEGASGAGAGS